MTDDEQRPLPSGAGNGPPVQLELALSSGALSLPRNLDPTLLLETAAAFDSPDYLFEVRWDCVRAIATIARDFVALRNPRLGEIQAHFPELSRLNRFVDEPPIILDGEIVLVDRLGRPDFDALQARLEAPGDEAMPGRQACYLAYDILYRGNKWLIGEPLARRKRSLTEAVRPGDCIYVSEYFDTEGVALFEAVSDSDLEGIVAKAKGSPYTLGARNPGWLAVKRARRAELVVGGYSVHIRGGQGDTQVLLGAFDPYGNLEYAGSSPLPENEPLRTQLLAALNGLQIETCPFRETPRVMATWVRPETVATISFGRWDVGEPFRGPRFERLRLDVRPADCLLPSTPPPAGSADSRTQRARPRLTMLTTLPLPLPGSEHPSPPERPRLRLVGEE